MTKLPLSIDINNLIDDLRIFSWEVSDILIYYSKIIKESPKKNNFIKEDSDGPVTLADLKVNETIIKRINDNYKDISWEILSEENSKLDSFNINRKADWLWILDPLDGTKDFIQGTGNYAMHLALNYKRKPLIGVVLIPEKNQLWLSDGQKTWCETREKILIQPTMQTHKILKEMTLVTSKNHRNEKLNTLIAKAGFKNVVVMGSIGCKIASILRGESDIYISLSMPGQSSPKDWDLAAPEAILNSAGGSITNLENENLSYDQKNFENGGVIIASNNKVNHQEICLQVKQLIKKFDILPF